MREKQIEITEDELLTICHAFHKWMRTCDNPGTTEMWNAIHKLEDGDYSLAMADALKEAGFSVEGY